MSIFIGNTEIANMGSDVLSVYAGSSLVWAYPGFSFSSPHSAPEWDSFTLSNIDSTDYDDSEMRFNSGAGVGYVSKQITVSPGVEYRWRMTGKGGSGSGADPRYLRVGTTAGASDIASSGALTWTGNTHTLLFTPSVSTVWVSIETNGSAFTVFADYECVPN